MILPFLGSQTFDDNPERLGKVLHLLAEHLLVVADEFQAQLEEAGRSLSQSQDLQVLSKYQTRHGLRLLTRQPTWWTWSPSPLSSAGKSRGGEEDVACVVEMMGTTGTIIT